MTLVEFIAIARTLDADPVKLFKDFVAGEPGETPAKKPRKVATFGTSIACIKSRLVA